jgi:integrase
MTEYSEHTILRYNQAITSIRRLYEDNLGKKCKIPECLDEDCDKIIEIIKLNYELSSIHSFISAVLWELSKQSSYDTDYINKIKEKYRVHGKEIKESVERSKIGKEFELTEKEKKNFMVWEDILKFRQSLLINLRKDDYNSMIEFLIISLYTLHPPARADYANMKLFIDDSFVPENYKENYCVLQTNPRFVFNKYKTAKDRGPTIIKIFPELHDILLDWVELNESEYLLSSYIKSKNLSKPFTENTLCRRITLIFQKYLDKSVTINTLRHSFISFMSKNDQEYDRKKENAEKMMHSVSMADTYRRIVY